MFITFDGIDGSGKSVQLHIIAKRLMQQGYDVLVTREPGGTLLGERIRQWVMYDKNSAMCAETELLLYVAARAQHVYEVIRPALLQGKIVLCDRFADASVVYQGYALGQPLSIIDQLNAYAIQGCTPVRTYVCDVSFSERERRLRMREADGTSTVDRIEQRARHFHEQVRAGFLQLVSMHPERIRLIDSERPLEAVTAHIWQDIMEIIRTHANPQRPPI